MSHHSGAASTTCDNEGGVVELAPCLNITTRLQQHVSHTDMVPVVVYVVKGRKRYRLNYVI
eukprot:scaffold437762_cov48-Prasinocladus_malaysianus.AAC.1